MVASAIFKLALKAATPKSFSKMKSDYVPSPVVKETTDVLKALGKTEDDIVKFRQPKSKGGQKLEGSEKEVYKNPDLEEQAIALDEGLITLGEFKEARDILKPRKTYGTVPKLYENFDIIGSLPGAKGKEYGIVGVNKNLKSGELVSSRFDIPAYRDYGRYVVTIRKGNELFGYAPTAILKNVKFTGNPNASKFSKIKDPGKKSFKIAQGKSKTPFAVMEGKWQNMSPESTHKYAEDLMDAGKVNKYGETDKEWTEIGFDPASKSSFYNRSTGEPIFAADKVVQIGPMLLARGIKKPTKEQLKSLEFTTKAGKKIKGYKEGGQIMPMQYGGGLSNAYSTLSERRQNQNMYGMGEAPSQMSSVFQDPMETSAFSPVNMEKGGDIVVPKERMINDQPHQLSYINPQEAGLLKALGGSGRRVDGIPAYFDTGMDNDFSEGTGESFSGGDMSGSDDSGQDALSTFLGESSLADAFGTPSDPIGPGEGFEAGPDDKESTDQSLASYMRSDPQGFMNRATDKKGNFRSQQVADLVQAAADRGNLQGIGIPFANAMEKAGLASFGKGMRSSLEAFTPGKALTRNDYDPEVLAGNVDLSENPNKVAIQAFGDGIRYSKSGDSIADVTAQMSALGFTEDQINNAAQAFGYSPNSTAQASQVYDSLNDARKDGAIQGLGLVGSILTSPISGFSSLGRGFYGQRDEKGNPIEKSVMDRVGDEVMQTDLGKSISGSISDTLGKDSKAGEIASTIGKGIGMINDPFGTILGQRGIRQTSVPNILEATPDNRYFSGPSSETPSGLEKGISSIVDFFGGPQAAYRNNIDVRQGEGQDEPISRRPRINEPVESATASSSGSNDGRLMNKFFAGLAATNVGKKSSGEGSIFRLIKSQNPQLTDDQIRAMIPNENNFA